MEYYNVLATWCLQLPAMYDFYSLLHYVLFTQYYFVLSWLQSKGDLSGAEEHYFLATLADPKDGDILMQYAKLVWELYHDKDRAYSYFKRAALAAPEDR